LQVRDEAKDGSLLLELRLQLGDGDKRLGGVAVEIEDDEGRHFSAVLLDLLQELFDGLDEPDLDAEFLGRLLDLAGEEQIVDEDVNTLGIVGAELQGLHVGVRKIGRTLLLEVAVAALLLPAAGASKTPETSAA